MTKCRCPLALLSCLVLGLTARADTKLAANSPFAPPGGGAAAAENQALELRGILMDSEGYRFSIYDPVKRTGQWVRVNESGHEFLVRTHDVANDTITLDYQGRTLTLPLRTSKVTGVAIVEPPQGPRPGPGVGGGPVPKPGSAEDVARFNRAVEEIKRRRALRERGPIPTPMLNQAAPGISPQPAPR